MSNRHQAVVVGGGLVGLAAAIAVARVGVETLHLAPPAPADRRTSALMRPSVDFLLESGLIADPETVGHPLSQIRIIDATSRLIRAPETLFDARDAGLPAFGWNFANTRLAESFEAARVALPNLSARAGTVSALSRAGDNAWRLELTDGDAVEAELLVGADGKKSLIREAGDFRARENGFAEAALVCDLELGRPLGGTSVEFHYPRGPFTLVPAGERKANLVWIDDRATLKAAQESGRDGLRQIFLERSQRLFGDIQLVTPAHMFPLSTITLAKAGQNGIVLAGESAHAFPPIGAQGLNLGLRDVADLTAALASATIGATGWAQRVSENYAERRAGDLARTGSMVDALFRSLLTDFLPAQALRAGGLWALRSLPGLRRTAFSLGMGSR